MNGIIDFNILSSVYSTSRWNENIFDKNNFYEHEGHQCFCLCHNFIVKYWHKLFSGKYLRNTNIYEPSPFVPLIIKHSKLYYTTARVHILPQPERRDELKEKHDRAYTKSSHAYIMYIFFRSSQKTRRDHTHHVMNQANI